MGDVRLVDLEIIKRYSLAVRQETAPAEDLLAVLEASRDAVLAAMGGAPDGSGGADANGATNAKAGRAASRKPRKTKEPVS